jgi:S-adenosylmethionine synthetase
MSSLSFSTSPKTLFTSESVSEGHPDKVCDQISDAVLDHMLGLDSGARVACESVTSENLVVVTGELGPTLPSVDTIRDIVKGTVRSIGYDRPGLGFSANEAEIVVRLKKQSSDIAQGVNRAFEARANGSKNGHPTDTLDGTGAGDQGMMIGFACDETPELMPLPIALAHKLSRRLAEVRKSGTIPYLRPDGKSQVTVEYRYGKPVRVDTVVISTQHDGGIDQGRIYDDVLRHVVREVVPADLLDASTHYFVNPTGAFEIGGPMGDAGLTGRKIIVDTYGGMARHGGGAFSGKDPTKVDRSAAYAARYVAKNVVAAGLAERFELQVAYAIGVAHPVSIMCETFGTARVPEETIVELIKAHFDLRPAAIIRDLDLRRPIYKATAAYGHFGREDGEFPWERTDKAEALRTQAGLVLASVNGR